MFGLLIVITVGYNLPKGAKQGCEHFMQSVSLSNA